VDAELRRRLEQSGYGRSGFAEHYDRFRPRPPLALLELLPPLAGVDRPSLVVDLGCGTGLSTRFWAELADEAVGVEPNDAMRTFAEQATDTSNVRYLGASSYETGLPDACADLVTASQSLHWMRPERVFPEIGRILRPGGVFCAYEYRGLVTGLWEPEEAFAATMEAGGRIRRERGLAANARRFPPSVERLESSGIFGRVRELSFHNVEEGDGERLVGFALAIGAVRTPLDDGASEHELGLDRLREVAARMPPTPWVFLYCAWLGIRA